jgi:hypothetical protein
MAVARKVAVVNPFYVVLVLAGTVFCVTACAYGVMAFRDLKGGHAAVDADSGGLMEFLDQHGAKLLAAEVAVLALATVGAMWTDSFWTRRAAEQRSAERNISGSPSAGPSQRGERT